MGETGDEAGVGAEAWARVEYMDEAGAWAGAGAGEVEFLE